MAKENAKNIGKETRKRNLAAQQPKKKTSAKEYFKGMAYKEGTWLLYCCCCTYLCFLCTGILGYRFRIPGITKSSFKY